MIYVMSDVHGRIDLFDAMLDKINFSGNDMIYVVGDVIDRGGGLTVLKKIMELNKRGQCELIAGNHELVFDRCCGAHLKNDTIGRFSTEVVEEAFKPRSQPEIPKSKDNAEAVLNFVYSLAKLAGTITKQKHLGYLKKSIEKSWQVAQIAQMFEEWETFQEVEDLEHDEIKDIRRFIESRPQEAYVEIGDKAYLLVHGGLHDNIDLQAFTREDFYMNPVNKEILTARGYRDDATVIFGHTTTRDINIYRDGIYEAPNKIWFDGKYNDKIGIDCGASFPNGQLGCLRLDDMAEFYVENTQKLITPLEKITAFFERNNFTGAEPNKK